ncbi:hypothetical protein Egran_03141 [Elaphomyces granulatus]|uniref:PNPLA domain-containing protein n=1 Tax=Elaphomyces granulatus TaxID=519963 RepID=A0A232LY52_9EURO|nr:hypothetical protein Egran_03141 [Elaphomyces granulatus]
MSFDGGGSRGIVPLEYLRLLQDLLPGCPLHEQIDFAPGTSSGGLIALGVFHQQWNIYRCGKLFESLAVRCSGEQMFKRLGRIGIALRGYTLVRPNDIDKEPLLWEVGRATSAAPIFFRPIEMASGVFWDGCLGFPNPIELALWESAHIWPDTTPDIAISLGTGIEPRKGSGEQRQAGNSIRRLWHSFMDFLDGESRYQDIDNSNGLGKYTKSSFFRFNTQLHSAVRLDDIENLDQIRQGIHQCPRSRKDLVEVASSSYFEFVF